MSKTKEKRNKKIIITMGALGLFFVVGATVIYRGHEIGYTHVPWLSSTMSERPEKDEFLTGIFYEEPFRGTEENLAELNQKQLAAAITSENSFINYLKNLLNVDALAKNIQYQPSIPYFTPLQSEDDDGTIQVTNETTIAPSEDRRSLGYSGQRKLLVDTKGNISLAYRRYYQDYYQIFMSTLQEIDDGYILMTPNEPLSERTLGITQRVPAIEMDERGLMHVLWYGSDNEEYPDRRQIIYARSKGSPNFWERNNLVSYVEGYESEYEYWQEHPSVTVGEFNDVFVAWEGKDEVHENQQIKFSRSFDGGDTWSEWVNIEADQSVTFSRPTIIYTENDILHMFAYSPQGSQSDTNQIHYTYSEDLGTNWQPWRMISTDTYDARHISATIVNEQPLITYRVGRGGNGGSDIVYQLVDRDTIGTPVPVAPTGNYQFFPSVSTVRNSNTFCVTWIEEDTASEFPNEDPTDGDILLSCLQPYATQTAPVFNLTPTGSHLYPVLPRTIEAGSFPIAYYDDEMKEIVLRLISLD